MTEDNIGKYFYIDDTKKLYTLSRRANDGLIAFSLGDWPAQGPQGAKGETGDAPTIAISNNNTWVINGVDTGKPSRGSTGASGATGTTGATGIGIGNMTAIESDSYAPTVTTASNYDVYTTNADVKFTNNGQALTDTVSFKFKVKSSPITSEEASVEADHSVEFGHDVYADGNLQAGYDVEVGRNLLLPDASRIQDHDGVNLVQIPAYPNTIAMRSAGGKLIANCTAEDGDKVLVNKGYLMQVLQSYNLI